MTNDIQPNSEPSAGGSSKPHVISSIFFEYGYTFGSLGIKKKARRSRLTGNVQLEWWNETFHYWCFVDGTDMAKKNFAVDKKYWI